MGVGAPRREDRDSRARGGAQGTSVRGGPHEQGLWGPGDSLRCCRMDSADGLSSNYCKRLRMCAQAHPGCPERLVAERGAMRRHRSLTGDLAGLNQGSPPPRSSRARVRRSGRPWARRRLPVGSRRGGGRPSPVASRPDEKPSRPVDRLPALRDRCASPRRPVPRCAGVRQPLCGPRARRTDRSVRAARRGADAARDRAPTGSRPHRRGPARA